MFVGFLSSISIHSPFILFSLVPQRVDLFPSTACAADVVSISNSLATALHPSARFNFSAACTGSISTKAIFAIITVASNPLTTCFFFILLFAPFLSCTKLAKKTKVSLYSSKSTMVLPNSIVTILFVRLN